MKVNDVLTCALPSWYEKFKKYTVKSLILPMPPEVLAYMRDSGTLVLPEGCQAEPEKKAVDANSDNEEQDDWDTAESSGGAAEAKAPKLEAFNQQIRDAIARLGGSVFPKLNWSAPKDATWIALNNSMRCSTPGDMYLLLKSSIFATHDLMTPFKDCDDKDEVDTTVDYCIVLRKWLEINPADEFRCFVRNKELIGICQRDISQSYAGIGVDKANIRSDIISFWHEVVENRFPLESYAFDVYRPSKDSITLMDFSPFGVTTDALLFSWYEFRVLKERARPPVIEPPGIDCLCEDIEEWLINERNARDSNMRSDSPVFAEKPDFRYINCATGVQPSPYLQYSLPVDFVDLSTGQDPRKLIDFLQMKVQDDAEFMESSDDELL